MANQRGFNIFLALFFVSGASALIFETLWQRMMVLVFGASALATTAILTAFFCGIAFGSKWGGKMLSRWKQALLFYAIVELWIGLWGISVPTLLKVVGPLYIDIFQQSSPSPMASLLYRFLMSVLVVLPATLGMGATIPIMNRLLTERCGGVGRGVAMAYGVNTAGAVLGCLLTGFLLIRVLGMSGTLYAAAFLNAVVVVAAVALSRTELAAIPAGALPASRQKGKGGKSGAIPVRYPQFLVGIYAATGFLALGFEILWLRILGIYNTNSLTTFTLALSIYLLGFALGSIVLYPVLSRRMSGLDIFKLANLGPALLSLASVRLIYSFPRINEYLLSRAEETMGSLGRAVVGKEALFSLIVVFFPTIFMGLAYPALCAVLIPLRGKTGEKSGSYYFIGNLGSIGGILTVGLFLIPALGLVGTLALLCAAGSLLVLLTQGLDLAATRHGRRAFMIGGSFAFAAAVIYGFSGHPFNVTGPVAFKGGFWEQVTPGGGLRREIIRRYKEGPTATILVREERSQGAVLSRVLLVDEQGVASTDKAARIDAKMLAHIPLLLHPDPKRALTVGFGSGVTSWSMTQHDIEVEAVEIEPEVINSAYLFEAYNRQVLQDPSLKVIINDARDYLGLTDKHYDVISTDATNLKYKQNSNLYTREYFALISEKLTESGIACAWVPVSGIIEEDFRTLLRTFSSVFPHTSVWFMNNALTNFMLFVGTPGSLKIDLKMLQERMRQERVREDLRSIGVAHPFQFVHFLHMDEQAVREYAGPGSLHTDNRPVLEFSSPASMYFAEPLMATNLKGMLTYRPDDYRDYVYGLTEREAPLFAKATRWSQLWTDTISLFFLHITREYGSDEIQFLWEAVGTSRAALNVFSYKIEDPQYLRYFLARRDAVSGGAPYATLPARGRIREDFDGGATIPIHGRIDPLPTGSPRPDDRERFRLASGIEMGAGRSGTYALTLRNTQESGGVAHVLPLALAEPRPFSVQFWIMSRMGQGGEVGVAVQEFDRVTTVDESSTPGQAESDRELFLEAMRRSGTWEWQKVAFTVRPQPATKMVHLMFSRSGPFDTRLVAIDDLEISSSLEAGTSAAGR
jgi:spermidine synthase